MWGCRCGLGCLARAAPATELRGPARNVQFPTELGRALLFPPTQSEIDRYPPVTHPIVRAHPYTGRK